MRNAADWILKQKLGGLIYCSSEESNVWGICSWRNIIPGYTLTGAVTEINAECYKALRCAAELAAVLGEADDAARFDKEADELREAINAKLLSGKTGLYLLNIDTQGEAHHDLTGDLIFPAMLGVADPETERRILDVLYTPMFWTPYGMRTVAVGEHNYDPEFGIRLVGGIWPNLTVWVSYANRKLYPDRLVEGMRNAYRICEVPEPKKFKNLGPRRVPGMPARRELPEPGHGPLPLDAADLSLAGRRGPARHRADDDRPARRPQPGIAAGPGPPPAASPTRARPCPCSCTTAPSTRPSPPKASGRRKSMTRMCPRKSTAMPLSSPCAPPTAAPRSWSAPTRPLRWS